MANYKVVDADQLDAAMSATADSIRAKTGGTDPIVWDLDNGFKSVVEGIQTGGAVIPDNARLYYVSTAESGINLTALISENSAVGVLTE